MSNLTNWQLLFVDDEATFCEQAKEYLEEELLDGGEFLQVTTLSKFEDALKILETRRFDLVVLDVRLESQDPQLEEAGISTLNAIKQKCFIPIVFYTGVPQIVRGYETCLIRVIEKTDGFPRLLEVLNEIVATGLLSVNRALIQHLETIQRDYMWDFVVKHWEQLCLGDNRTDLAYLLARRLAKSLSSPAGIKQLAEDLKSPVPSILDEGVAHPVEYYLIPPINSLPLTGDLYYGKLDEQISYYLVLTPSCDFVTRTNGISKAEYVLLAQCFLLEDQAEYKEHKANNTNNTKSDLRGLLKNNRKFQPERFYFLPGVFSLPNLVVDFQRVFTLSRQELDNLERKASLDSPFSEALLVKFTRFFGRLGTPDLNNETIDNILVNVNPI